jgi:tetratricopeptide (TPR) repeat protein
MGCFLKLGIAYLDQKDWPTATTALRTAALLGPDHPEAHYNLALAYERDNALPKALQEITVSLRLRRLISMKATRKRSSMLSWEISSVRGTNGHTWFR